MTLRSPTRSRPRRAPAPRGRRRAIAGWVLLAVGLVTLGLLVWGALAGLAVARHALAAQTHVAEVRSAVDDDDFSGALAATREAARETRAAQASASALPLRLASALPGRAGSLVDAARTLVSAGDLAVSSGALPLVEVAATVEDPSNVLREDGSVDVDALRAAADRATPAAAALTRAARRLDGLDVEALPASLRGRVDAASTSIDSLAGQAGAASGVLSALPDLLGASSPRTYLVAFQNTAELRPTGGIVGTWALVGVDDGHTTLTATGSNDDLDRLTGPVRDLGPEYAALYPARAVSYSQDINLSPHFPYAGQLLSDLWAAQGRPAPDGVIAVDPSGMAPLLQGAGDLAVPGGPTVNAQNVVDVLLRQTYITFDGSNEARKQYLSTVVGTAFSKALGGGAFNAATVSGLTSAARQGHLAAWSSHPDEQRALADAGVAGALPAPSSGTVGVYLTNVSASKLDYYVTEDVTTEGGCAATPASLQVTLHSSAPGTVPDYVANKDGALPRTTETLLVGLYLPPARGIASVTVAGNTVPFSSGTERGWSVARFAVTVPRAASTTVDVTLSGVASPVTHVLTQPLVEPAAHQIGTCSS